MNNPVFHIAAHEIRLSWKDTYFRLILIIFLALTALSTVLGALQVHQQMTAYKDSVALLQSMGKIEVPPPPSFNPLGVSKDFVNYTSMIGALMAILVGWNSIQNEKRGKLLSLVLSRPVFRDSVITGKFIGSGIVLFIVIALSYITVNALLLLLTGSALNTSDSARMAVYFVGVWLYLLVFSSLSQLLTIWQENTRSALLLTIIIWLVITFLLPQIGDTMDLDNQIPGGFFSYLGLDKAQEQSFMSHFAWYEYFRNGLEEMSPTKHFERLSFALLNIKPGFSDYTTIQVVTSKALNLLVLVFIPVIFMIMSIILFLRREMKNK